MVRRGCELGSGGGGSDGVTFGVLESDDALGSRQCGTRPGRCARQNAEPDEAHQYLSQARRSHPRRQPLDVGAARKYRRKRHGGESDAVQRGAERAQTNDGQGEKHRLGHVTEPGNACRAF